MRHIHRETVREGEASVKSPECYGVLLIFHHPRRFFLFFRALDSLELAGHTKKGVIESIVRRRKTQKRFKKNKERIFETVSLNGSSLNELCLIEKSN
jgi:hypothetical protein